MLNLCLVLWMSSQNPSEATPYERWASFEAGSRVRMRQSGWAAGRRVDVDRDYLLVRVAPEKVVLEERCARAGRPDFRIRIEIRADLPSAGPSSSAGVETIDVDGRSLACRVTERTEAGQLRVREWWCAEIPGGLVRREVRSDAAPAASTSLQVLSWTAVRRLSP